MPVVIPIIAAYASSVGTAALLAGSITIANVAAGLTMLGSVLSIAGTVTKNEKLSKIGNGLMLVGGATSLVNSLAGGTPAGAAAAAAKPGPPVVDATVQAGKIQAPPVLDTVVSPRTDLLTSPAQPLQGQGALLDASNPATQATNSVAAIQNPVAPTAAATAPPPPGTISTEAGLKTGLDKTGTQKPGIIASFLKDNAAATTVLGQGIVGAYQKQQEDLTARRKIEAEQKIRDFDEQRRIAFNTSVSGVQIQEKPWDNPLDQTQNQPGNRSLIGMVRNPA